MRNQSKPVQAIMKFIATLLIAITLMGACTPAIESQAATSTTQTTSKYQLGKKFTVKYGKTVTIPNKLSIKFEQSRLWDTKEVSFDILVTLNGKAPELKTLVYTPEGQPWANIATIGDYTIKVTKAVHEKSVTLIVNKPKQRKSSTMTGESDKYYTTKANEYFEDERFVLYVPKGITLRQDTLVMINEILDLLEEKTGWKFFDYPLKNPASAYGPNRDFGYDDNYYFYVDPEGKKIQIEVVEDNNKVGYISSASENEVVYVHDGKNTNNMMSPNTIAHELAHVLHAYNVAMPEDSDTFTEGFAMALAYEITEELKDKYPDPFLNYIIASDVEQNPDGSPSPITPDTAQELFEHNYRIDPDERMQQRNYQIGGALNYYIMQKYGAKGFVKFKKNVKKAGFKIMSFREQWNDPDYTLPSISDYSKVLKTTFGKNFFVNFAKWFKNNKDFLLEAWYK